MGAAVVCLLGAVYLEVERRDQVRLKDANELGRKGNYLVAAREAERVSRAPADGRALLVRAYALAGARRDRQASDAFAAAARRDPNNWVIHRDWALLLQRLGNVRRARAEMGRALGLNPRMQLPPGFIRSGG
jgi:Flp pilus assembly protein TadD